MIDFTFDLNEQSWALLYVLNGELNNSLLIRNAIEDNNWSLKVAPWYNGRERGFQLSFSSYSGLKKGECLNIMFAENRNSDDVVLYKYQSNLAPFNPVVGFSGIPDEAYTNGEYYSYMSLNEVATRIIFLMEDFIKLSRKEN